jgi:hypothetical protein
MHFHLPKPLHGWRAFAGEVGVVVLGVLIALTANALVDAWQWRDKVERAEAAMRLELAEDNGPQAYGRALIGSCLDGQITRVHDGAGQVPLDQLRQWIRAYSPPFRTWDSEAWKVIVASEIGSHMGPDRLVAWSAPYRIMPMLTDQNQREAQWVIDLRETLPASGDPSPSDLQSLRRTAAQLKLLNNRFITSSQLLLGRIGANGAQVPLSMQRELIADARAMYGSCVTVPDLRARPGAELLTANLKSASLSAQ